MSLTWDAPPASGPGLEGYDVFAGTSSGLESATPVNDSPLPGTSYTVPDLTAQTTYYFTVTAVYQQCSDGCTTAESSPSAEAHATTASQVTAPGAPTGLVAVAAGRTQVSLTWNASSGPGVEGYDVFEGTRASGESVTPLNDSPVIGTTRRVTGLKPGTTYYFTVSAVGRAGESARSNEAHVTLAGGTGPGGPHVSKSGSVSRTHAPPGGLPLLAWAVIILAGAAAALGAARRWLRARSVSGTGGASGPGGAPPGPGGHPGRPRHRGKLGARRAHRAACQPGQYDDQGGAAMTQEAPARPDTAFSLLFGAGAPGPMTCRGSSSRSSSAGSWTTCRTPSMKRRPARSPGPRRNCSTSTWSMC